MHVLQTAVPPPNQGRINFPIIGWSENSRNAPKKIAEPNTFISQIALAGYEAAIANQLSAKVIA